MYHRRSERYCIADTKKLHYLPVLSTKVHTMRIGNLESNLNNSYKKVEEEYISLDIPLITFVSVARLNQTK